MARWIILSSRRPLDPLTPDDRLFPDRAVPEPLLATLSGPLHGEMAGGGAPSWMECGFRNVSDRMVILRCLGPSSFFLERVVFPFELLSFACPAESEVEILSHNIGGPELLEAMPARTLRLDAPLALERSARGATEPLDAENPWLQAG
jgi:hypothetical protein